MDKPPWCFKHLFYEYVMNKLEMAWLSPIEYYTGFVDSPKETAENLWTNLPWVHRDSTPRLEYYWSLYGLPYTYGSGNFSRTYESQPLNEMVEEIRKKLNDMLGVEFDVCFVNGYRDQRDHLGWHADDSPEMDLDKPIAIISLGAERHIWFRDNNWSTMVRHTDDVLLNSGSLCIMKAGMQRTHQHRIPKSSNVCGYRISLTFRCTSPSFITK